jgi:hypothetical protein
VQETRARAGKEEEVTLSVLASWHGRQAILALRAARWSVMDRNAANDMSTAVLADAAFHWEARKAIRGSMAKERRA